MQAPPKGGRSAIPRHRAPKPRVGIDVAAGHEGHPVTDGSPDPPRAPMAATPSRSSIPSGARSRMSRRRAGRTCTRDEPRHSPRVVAPVALIRRRALGAAHSTPRTEQGTSTVNLSWQQPWRRAGCTQHSSVPVVHDNVASPVVLRRVHHARRARPRHVRATESAHRCCAYELPSRWRRSSASMKASRSPSSTASTLPVS